MHAARSIAVTILLSLLMQVVPPGRGQIEEGAMNDSEATAIKQVIQSAYVDGVHTSQDIEKIRSGFHDEFRMMVLDGNAIKPVQVDEWLARVSQLKADNPAMWKEPTTVVYDLIDVTGRSAVAKMHVYKGDRFFSTDCMFLYKIDDAWMIVSKVFVTEPAP